MTSDRGNSGGAEMQLSSNTPVTPKTTGLNPNALEFQSKTPATPLTPDAPTSSSALTPTSPSWPDVDALPNVITIDADNAETIHTSTDIESFNHMNGDAGKLPPGITFPPTPESPEQMTGDYVNGTLPGEVLFSSDGSEVTEGPMEGTIPDDQLRAMLKSQLEYYFSRENLANDSYLVSQMNADQYVPITTVAGFNQVKRLTINHQLVVDILRESPNVQVDETGDKVRPLHKRCVVILREIPDTTPLEDVEMLFSGANCPKFVSCEFAHNNSWYVTFEGDEDAQRAYQYLREDVKTFLGRPIMARIKAKPLLRSTFIPKNGFKQSPTYDPSTVYTPQQPTTQTPQTTQQRFTYPQMPNTAAQYTLGQQSYPFFPPSTVMHSWPTSPMPFFDPGQAFAANGYTPTATFKLSSATNRHGYANMRTRGNQGNKSHVRGNQAGQDRERLESHTSHERRGPTSTTRSSPRSDLSHSSGARGRGDRHGERHSERHSNSHGNNHGNSETSHSHHSHNQGSSHHHHHHNHHHHTSTTTTGSGGHHSHPHHSQSSHVMGGASTASTTTSTTTAAHTTTPTTTGGGGGGGKDNTNQTTLSSPSPTVTVAPHATSAHTTVSTVNTPPANTTSSDMTSSSSSRNHSDGGLTSKDMMSGAARRGGGYRSRRRRDDETNKGPRSAGPHNAVPKDVKSSGETPRFELEATSFPPLPGSTNKATTGDVFENKMSDVVKGTAKALTREVVVKSAPTPAPSSSTPASQMAGNNNSPSAVITPTPPPPAQAPPTPTTPAQPPAPPPTDKTLPPSTVVSPGRKDSVTSPVNATPDVTPSTPATTVSKDKTTTGTTSINGSLPTPPTSPQKPLKSSVGESKSEVSQSSSSSSPAAAAAAAAAAPAATAAAAAASAASKQDEPQRLSYAQMVQRTKEREAERQKEGGDGTVKDGSTTPTSTTTSTTTTSSRPQALREQSQMSQSSPTRSETHPIRKDREEPREQRLPTRRAKENRDRRGDMRLPERDSRERFRRREREGETTTRVLSK